MKYVEVNKHQKTILIYCVDARAEHTHTHSQHIVTVATLNQSNQSVAKCFHQLNVEIQP